MRLYSEKEREKILSNMAYKEEMKSKVEQANLRLIEMKK